MTEVIHASRNNPVRVALAGLGRVGTVHANNILNALPQAELVRIQDADEAVARARSVELGGIPWSLDFTELAADPAIEAILIATPSTLHLEHIRIAARAGKHIFVEKPIALTRADTFEAIEIARANGVRLQVGFQLRFEPTFVEARQAIDNGDVGQIYQLRITHRDYKPRDIAFTLTSGGLYADVTVHDFDLARFLAGEIAEVTAFGDALSPGFADSGDIDNGIVVVRFTNGAFGVIDNTRVGGYGFDFFAEILGSRSTVRAVLPLRKSGIEVLTDARSTTQNVTRGVQSYNRAYIGELKSFLEDVVRGGRPPESSSLDAAAAFVLAQAAEISRRERRTVKLDHTAASDGVIYDIR